MNCLIFRVCTLVSLGLAVFACPLRAQDEAAFQAAESARLVTPPHTQERGKTAQEASQAASQIAWQHLEANRFSEASLWFERSAEREREANAAQRAHWERVLTEEVPATEKQFADRIQEWQTKIEAAADDKERADLRAAIAALKSMRLTLRYGAVSMLQQLAREARDLPSWLRLQEQELEIRRTERATLQEIEATQLQLDESEANIARALERLAQVQVALGRFDEAEKNALEALERRRRLPASLPARALHEAHSALGSMYLESLGDGRRAAEQFEAALHESERSLALQLEQWDADPAFSPERRAAMTPEELATRQQQRAETRGLMLATATMGRAKLLSDLAFIAQERGDLRAAREWTKKLAEVAPALPAGNVPWLGLARGVANQLALSRRIELALNGGNRQQAQELIAERIALLHQLGSDGGAASALFQAGRLFYEEGRWPEARQRIETARRLWASAQNLHGVLNALGTLALVEREEGRFAEAAARADEALTLARHLGGRDQIAWAQRTLASIRLRQNQIAAADTLLQEAALHARTTQSISDRIATLFLQGQLREAQNANEKALEAYREAMALQESVRATAEDESRFSDVRANYRLYERAVRLLVKMGRGEEAFQTLARARSKQLQDALGPRSIRSDDPALRAKLDDAAALEERLRAVIAQLEAERSRPAGEQNAEKLGNLQKVVAQTQGEFFLALHTLEEAHPAARWRVDPADVPSMRHGLSDDALIIQYAPLGEQLYIFLFEKNGLKIVETQTKPAEIWARIKAARAQLEKPGVLTRSAPAEGAATRGVAVAGTTRAPNAPSEAARPLEANLTELYDLLVRPIEADIAPKKTLAFIPTQWLFYFPMGALAQRENGKLRFLIEDKNVVVLATTGQVSKATRKRATDELGSGVVAFGDPKGAGLPAARVEVAEIGRLFPTSRVLQGEAVSKTAVLDRDNWEKRVVHFATHGVLNADSPTASYLQLSPAEEPDADPDSQKLLIGEILAQELRKVEVVTLSACQTLLGQRNPGLEVMSLAGAFNDAGAQSVVASLWNVADDSTRVLMVEFYSQIAAGKSKAEAMRAAQKKVLSEPEWAHPYFWAPFVLSGDWR